MKKLLLSLFLLYLKLIICQKILYNNDRIKLKLSKIPLKQDKAAHKHGPIVNIYITLHNRRFCAVKSTKNADIDKYKYSGYGNGFDSRGSFTHPF